MQVIQQAPAALFVHGSAGTLPRAHFNPRKSANTAKPWTRRCGQGQALLMEGGNARDAGCPIVYT
jgi:isoaspartyl peptidase/L-asparaginase-like protein (Ntn-hydrolase superfamily)